MSSSKKRVERLDSGETTRIWVTVPIETKETIGQYANKMGFTESRATQHLLIMGLIAETIALEGGKVVAHLPNGEEVLFANSQGSFLFRDALKTGSV